MVTQKDIDEINGPDELDQAFDKYEITADELIGDGWKIRTQLLTVLEDILDDENKDVIDNLDVILKLRDKIEDSDREMRRLKGMYAKEKSEHTGTFTLIQEIPKTDD